MDYGPKPLDEGQKIMIKKFVEKIENLNLF